MIAIFEVGTLWFWLFIVVVAFTLIAIQEVSESPGGWTSFWVVATFVALYYLGAGLSIKQLGLEIYHDPIKALVYFLFYTIVGTLWSFYKWKEIVDEALARYNVAVLKYNDTTATATPGWRVISRPSWEEYQFKPRLTQHKSRIFNWIFYWPLSFTWFVMHKPIDRLYDFIMERTKKVYEGIANRALNRAEKIKEDDMVH